MPFIKLSDIFTFICTLQKITEIAGFNLASNKDSYVCNKKLIKELTDGNILKKVLLEAKECKDYDKTFIHIYLEEHYNVQFVILSGSGESNDLSSFDVNLKESGYTVPCAEYHDTNINTTKYRVNCQPSAKVFSEVLVFANRLDNYYTYEVEVHSLGESINGHSLIYQGCFSNFVSDPAPIGWEKCQLKCLKSSFMLVGIKDNKYCGCQNNVRISDFEPTNDCDIKCDDGLRYCGGKNVFSVYLITIPLPYYKGCYTKLNPALITTPKMDTSVNPLSCLRFCDKYRYAVLQEGTHCLCVDQEVFEHKRPSHSHCAMNCKENRHQYCGGRDHASVYGTCRGGASKSMACSELLNCDSHLYDNFGRCHGNCKPNFKGDYCMDRIVNITITPRRKKYGQYVSVEASYLRGFMHKVQRYLPFILPWCSIVIFGGILWWTVPFGASDEDSDDIEQEAVKREVSQTLNILASQKSSFGNKEAKNVKDAKAVTKSKEKKDAKETKDDKQIRDDI